MDQCQSHFHESCPVSIALDVIGGKWKLQIVWILSEKSYRFGELKRQLPGISEKILIQQLKQLTEDGLVMRNQFPEVPPRVEYSVTRTGKSLLPLLQALKTWSQENLMTDYLAKKALAREEMNSQIET